MQMMKLQIIKIYTNENEHFLYDPCSLIVKY